ncbi:uncharacterized protein SPAPADRAFT_62080 [Spathaspora passalidarum NRRL Y-27907]|uniref:Uncharacterized protein n=1 Tax=Spathaspora passalidarum (strain NRRL Y-27907 / 11-Y1) TaxID=619300 RepID=G3AQF6_SPAPN|nr:uncharacterized protein SPAPADRAFT_62080 [Spathaspora passalidarum NRRL Y-27907]EGW31503.1 hypothetical protein SPAPADRAFT_62080 [Spathaspora passalidarum NRRL Y-27907]
MRRLKPEIKVTSDFKSPFEEIGSLDNNRQLNLEDRLIYVRKVTNHAITKFYCR